LITSFSKHHDLSTSKEIDPVGTCVGVGGARIKPILRELGQEKIDLIEWTDSLETLVQHSLKPADIDNVEIVEDNKAVVWLAQDQRSLAIGRMGQNISLASKLTGVEIQLQDVKEPAAFYSEEKGLSYEAVLETLQSALAAAYRKDFGNKQQNIDVIFDPVHFCS